MNHKKLIIVESPNKIKKIQSLVGETYKVMASIGHIRRLPLKSLGVLRDEGYQLEYEMEDSKKQVIASLVAETKKVGRDQVLIASDPDREGEAIAYHLAKVLGLDLKSVCRIEFHELTSKTILQALQSPRAINLALVKAQEARRGIDRLAGFEVSQVLNRKLKKVNASAYSAGRVQSPALKLIVEREQAITSFEPKSSYKLKASFFTSVNHAQLSPLRLTANYTGEAFEREDLLLYLEEAHKHEFQVEKVEKLEVLRRPSPAFITSTLQQDAIKKFKWGAKKVMDIAQQLFEHGLISYMRTDSPNLSEEALKAIEAKLKAEGQEALFAKTIYQSKNNAQEAHEAIRPTNFDLTIAGEGKEQQELYSLIYRRAIASQMIPATYAQETILIRDLTSNLFFKQQRKRLVESGFLTIYTESKTEEDNEDENVSQEAMLVAEGEKLLLYDMIAKGIYSNPPKRYDEAGLVSELEKLGIGRPSTYATILNQIIEQKQYAMVKTIAPTLREIDVILLSHEQKISIQNEKQSIGGDKEKLVPSEQGLAIIDFLQEHFSPMVNYRFTAEMEERLDTINQGKYSYQEIMKDFDNTHQQCLSASNTLAEVVERKTMEIGTWQGHAIQYGKNDKGAYLLYQGQFYKYLAEDVPNESEAQAYIQECVKASESRFMLTMGDLVVKEGPYGLYIEDKKGNKAPLKKTKEEAKALTKSDLAQILKDYQAWKKKQK